MPEIKHDFTAGKMNKDLDERIVPNGEYRDALNIQVKTTDSGADGLGDAGTAQNIKGNSLVLTAYETVSYIDGTTTRIIGSVDDEGNDRAFFFAAAPVPKSGIESLKPTNIINFATQTFYPAGATTKQIWVDSIIELKTSGAVTPVFVDRFAITGTWSDGGFSQPTTPYQLIESSSASDFRVGMILTAQKADGTHLIWGNDEKTIPGAEIINIDGINIKLNVNQTDALDEPGADAPAVFKAIHKERVLEFDYYIPDALGNVNNLIIPINVLDNLLFWTDGTHEPKRINIDRSKFGTDTTGNVHTRLVINHPKTDQEVFVSTLENLLDTRGDVQKENITVIKKKPIFPPTVFLSSTDRESDSTFVLTDYSFVQEDSTPETPVEGTLRIITFPSTIDFRIDDSFTFTEGSNSTDPITLKGTIVEINNQDVTLKMNVVDTELLSSHTLWEVTLDQKKPLFETKFGRFGYRYQYEDNEYSAFSPWSELAFLPGPFEYTPNKGYNKGMQNQVRKLVVKDFIPDDNVRPNDVRAVDILWKTTDNANVYIVKTVTREINSEWENFTDTLYENTGSITITSELISRVVESNQLTRAWDNVPKYALSQEVTGGRVVFANYEQGYDIKEPVGLIQNLKSINITGGIPEKSVKSLRTYKFGAVYGDKYGRETPVITNGYSINDSETIDGNTTLEKKFSKFKNQFTLKQNWEDISAVPLEWMDYIKFYVKETSNEYYNLVMDKWYDAEDGNVWVSFGSADRNKVDENTYLILKNEHGGQRPVEEEARYRIIDIQSEAPDFIKTDIRSFGIMNLPPQTVYTGGVDANSDGIPEKLVGNIELTNFPIIKHKHKDFEGTRKIRVIGEWSSQNVTRKGPWVTVSKILPDSDLNETAPDERGIRLTKSFTNADVNMYQLITSTYTDATLDVNNVDVMTNANYIQYKVEFADHVMENKPEFDGRFFVKLEKDDVLKTRVLNETEGEYVTESSYEIAYIEDTAFNQAYDNAESLGAYQNFEFNNNSETSFFNGFTTIDDNGFLSEFGTDTDISENFWYWFNSNKSTNIFIDGSAVNSGFELTTEDGNTNIIEQIYPNQNEFMASGQNGPVAFSSGILDWQFGQVTFSTTGSSFDSGADTVFRSKMQTPGTLFRFRTDPIRNVYKVISSNITGDVNTTAIDIESKNYATLDVNDDLANRSSIVVRFCRIDTTNGTELTDQGIDFTVWDPRGEVKQNGLGSLTLQIVKVRSEEELTEDTVVTNSACWETEPKEAVEIDLYYEASPAIPIKLKNFGDLLTFTKADLNKDNASLINIDGVRSLSGNFSEEIILPGDPFPANAYDKNTILINHKDTDGVFSALKTDVFLNDIISFKHPSGLITKSKVLDHRKISNSVSIPSDRATFNSATIDSAQVGSYVYASNITNNINSISVIGAEVIAVDSNGEPVDGVLEPGTFVSSTVSLAGVGSVIVLNRKAILFGTYNVEIIIRTGYYKIDSDVWKYSVDLPWHNCYSFGNGVESDRIRDDFNAPQLDNGNRVSTTFLNYGKEKIGSGMIYSGLYNSTSSVNDLSQFNMGEKITKNLNPAYGSIQAMKTRDGDVVVFTEDKVLKVQSSGKDAIFNADNNPQLTATDRVLGTAMPFSGDYGISKNPESLAWDSYRMYFADMQRGAVLRLSRDGVTPISDVGMKNYFRENLKKCNSLIGTFDGVGGEYNLTLNKAPQYRTFQSTTVSFNENSKGWVSFKSFIPTRGLSVTDKYYTTDKNKVYEHYSDSVNRNTFYETFTSSEVEVLFNEQPGSVKSFVAINYEGSKAKITQNLQDGNYYNLSSDNGWHVSSFNTDLQEGEVHEFIKKENKWFNKISGITTTESNLDTSEFTVQGIGRPTVITPGEGVDSETIVTLTGNSE